MDTGEFQTRISIWIALTGYGFATVLLISGSPKYGVLERAAWTAGCLAYVCHVLFAFNFFYEWSHENAIQETARQTRELTGISSGSGLYLNYLFTFVWVIDAAYWWFAGAERYVSRRKWISLLLHGFFIFMVLNGAVIFANGPVRWLGVLIIGAILIQTALSSKKNTMNRGNRNS